jgi:histidinol dehydrogenase
MKSPLDILDWKSLDEAGRADVLRRPAQRDAAGLLERARQIVSDVRARGDEALRDYTERLDGVRLESFAVSEQEFAAASAALTGEQKQALEKAIDTVTRFHDLQTLPPLRLETAPGVVCERMVVPLEAVGLYVPAGSAPLPSTALMLAVPAKIAGCPVRVMCTPPRPDGTADPAVLVAARLCGIRKVFKLGGAQAVAAMAYGTASVPKVVKIFGPGNSWVTAAKQIVAQDADGAALDMPAGPSEVLVIADESARPAFVAADLLAQAEHSPDAQVLLVTVSRRTAEACVAEVARQLADLPRREIAAHAIAESRVLLVPDINTAMDVCNRYAPEHLILQVTSPRDLLPQVRNAGSVFLGAWTPETMGDYCSGTNHVLPTYGHARAYSGLSVIDFVKRITVQELTADGLRGLGPTARTLARLESLDAHANAVTVRLDALAQTGERG